MADAEQFLARLRNRLAGGAPANGLHPVPPRPVPLPEPSYPADSGLDPVDLFCAQAEAVAARVTRVRTINDVPVDDLLRQHDVRSALRTDEPDAVAVGDLLAARGVVVSPASPESLAAADLGITAARAAIAATGSVVLDSDVRWRRSLSLLPPVHLCVVRASHLVPTTSVLVRGFDRWGEGAAPSNVVVVTGPSRSGDIELIMTLGVHGPGALELAVIDDRAP